ncbi:MAG: tyrosine-type recombinase/integrase [Oscillospiraceae bacterium]|nr:tyrosine-type recombinase/integrase [Oscillospiraceae bacterium]
MSENTIKEKLVIYESYLVKSELSRRTVSKYVRDVEFFYRHTGFADADIASVMEYKEHMREKYSISTVNSRLISLNRFWKWLDKPELCLGLLKCQRRFFTPVELTVEDYRKMTAYALSKGDIKWYLIMRCLGSMGLRVGELQFITYEAAKACAAEIYFKSKQRTILIPDEIASELLSYCRTVGITSGIIFTNKRKTAPLDNSLIWRGLKRCAAEAGIDKSEVYPHNFRHMFARAYMDRFHDIAELADILGHSSIETTRIYTKTSRETQRSRLGSLGL